uniref:Cobalamin (Vitamin B12) biosynthesis CbiX protein n=1 Tax=Cyanothece sp. (strain PCC 7425 / ATCC 29141) TaxID=395961 RepID=B8HRL2_CYAP4
MSKPPAYLLISHGSRDVRPQIALEHLARLVQQAVSASFPAPLVGTATLEFGPTCLTEQIQQFSQQAHTQGCEHVQILPLFLLPGVHVIEDVPQAVAQARCRLDQTSLRGLKLHLCPYLGCHPGMVRLLKQNLQTHPFSTWILLSHGSRRPQANLVVRSLAEKLGARVAYWSTSPGLEDCLHATPPCAKLGILPYFLFHGVIVDAIAVKVEQLQTQFQVELNLLPPLEPTNELVHLILDCLSSALCCPAYD